MTNQDPTTLLEARRHALNELLQQRRFGVEYRALQEEVLGLERIVAEERGEPHTIEWSLGEVWNGMAYAPVVLGDAFRCAIVFTTPTRMHAVLGFPSVVGYKLSDISDEVIEGHPLIGKGLIAYRSFIVKHSTWIAELAAIDRVHRRHDPQRWREVQHYLLCFKDRIFEAIALGVQQLGAFASSEQGLRVATAYVIPPTEKP